MRSFRIIFIGLNLVAFISFTSDLMAVNSNAYNNLWDYSDSLRSIKVTFQFEGKTYSGLLDKPRNKEVKSIMILVPGSGKTKMYTGKWNYELRKRINQLGIATFSYDKSGCGDSEGEFDYNQSVENSSEELVAAIQELRNQKIEGSQNIGLWGISRAGWICPLAIKTDNNIKYWISVSGPNHLDNIYHLLKTNWVISGKDQAEVEILTKEWLAGYLIQRKGGTYQEYLDATPSLSKDEFIKKLRGEYTEQKFLKFQNYLLDNDIAFDEKTGLQIMLKSFEETLEQVTIPVLAIFGEKDSQVDWRETINLYESTLSQKNNLTIKTLPDCNHLIKNCETGGFDENYKVLVEKGLGQTCDGYLNSIDSWLIENKLGNN